MEEYFVIFCCDVAIFGAGVLLGIIISMILNNEYKK